MKLINCEWLKFSSEFTILLFGLYVLTLFSRGVEIIDRGIVGKLSNFKG